MTITGFRARCYQKNTIVYNNLVITHVEHIQKQPAACKQLKRTFDEFVMWI